MFENSNAFATEVCKTFYSSDTVKYLNKTSNFVSTRFDWVTSDVMKWANWSQEDGGIDRQYWMAAYGLQWVINSGRVNGIATMAIRALNVRSLCKLIHELATYNEDVSTYAAYLMQKYV
jgi:hypothetical protein